MNSSTLPVARGASDRRPTPAEIRVLHSMLQQQREFRVDQLVQLSLPGSGGPLSSSHPEVAHSLLAGARAALHEVQHALWRIEEGTYGSCTRCGGGIGLARLEILPQAALCLTCQRAGVPAG